MSFLPLAWCKLDVNRPGNPRRIKSCLGWRSRWVVWCLLSRPLAFCWSRVCLFSFQNKTCLQCNSWKKHRFEDEDFLKPDAGKSQDWNLKPGYNLVFPKPPKAQPSSCRILWPYQLGCLKILVMREVTYWCRISAYFSHQHLGIWVKGWFFLLAEDRQRQSMQDL